MHEAEKVIRDSGLFTQVEPEWLVETDYKRTFVNRSRGVVIKFDNPFLQAPARIFHDRGGETYASTGWYDAEELTKWWIPVMKSDRAWAEFIHPDNDNGDITIALDYL
jgi:hypothetical protein